MCTKIYTDGTEIGEIVYFVCVRPTYKMQVYDPYETPRKVRVETFISF